MKKITLLVALTFLVSCFGGLMYFQQKDRYSVKISMIKIKKSYDFTAKWLDTSDENSIEVIEFLGAISNENENLENIKVSRNQLIYEEKLNESTEIVKLIEEALNDGKKERARYHFKRLRNNCIACHTRFRVGVNF